MVGDNNNDETFTYAQLWDRAEDTALALANTCVGTASPRLSCRSQPGTGSHPSWQSCVLGPSTSR